MHKAICYVSTISPGIAKDEIEYLLERSKTTNNNLGITGLLLFSGGNFLQIIEGTEKVINTLWNKISIDNRHFNIIKIFEQQILKDAYLNYESDFISENTHNNSHKLEYYEEHLQMLDKTAQQAVKNILDSFIKLN